MTANLKELTLAARRLGALLERMPDETIVAAALEHEADETGGLLVEMHRTGQAVADFWDRAEAVTRGVEDGG